MTGPHSYRHLDEDSKIIVEVDLRRLAEMVVHMNYGVHRLLSHIVDVRRKAAVERAVMYEKNGFPDSARATLRDELADGIEKLLLDGLKRYTESVRAKGFPTDENTF